MYVMLLTADAMENDGRIVHVVFYSSIYIIEKHTAQQYLSICTNLLDMASI